MTNHFSFPEAPASRNMRTLFVFEPNVAVRNYLKRVLGGQYHLECFEGEKGFKEAVRTAGVIDLVMIACERWEERAVLLAEFRMSRPGVPLIIMSCTMDMSEFEAFTDLSVCSVVMKPFVDGNLENAIARSLPRAEHDVSEQKEIRLDDRHSFVRSSKRMREIESHAMLVAPSDIPVLILGESGTGKEIIALYTHKMSKRSRNMFLKINCAAMPAELLESELFGYEQGAFTGATRMKPGKFETCNGGTIFLDEIGEMPAILQAKLLQVLQDGTFSRLGGRSPMRTDVRVIAATNINMKEAMAQKTFREDLYYRLNGLSLVLPPLRERLEEIPVLANYFMRKGAEKYELRPLPISQTLLHAFSRYPWPGNLRELENVINRFLILQDERAILRDLALTRPTPSDASRLSIVADSRQTFEIDGLKNLVRGLKGEAESAAIATALEEKGWNRKAAAANLQISYKALLYKIKQYELSPRSAGAQTA